MCWQTDTVLLVPDWISDKQPPKYVRYILYILIIMQLQQQQPPLELSSAGQIMSACIFNIKNHVTICFYSLRHKKDNFCEITEMTSFKYTFTEDGIISQCHLFVVETKYQRTNKVVQPWTFRIFFGPLCRCQDQLVSSLQIYVLVFPTSCFFF